MRKALWIGSIGLLTLGVLLSSALPQIRDRLYETESRVPAGDGGVVNPLRGWVPQAKYLPYKGLAHTLAYVGVTWRELEPIKGFYDFAALEAAHRFDYCRQNGIRLVLRLILDYPGEPDATQMPQWLLKETGLDGVWYNSGKNRAGYSPNYENPVLVAAHARLLAALGQRYGDDPLIAFIQLGSLGHYGEWHVTFTDTYMPSSPVTTTYVQHYTTAFPEKILLFRRPVNQAQGLKAGLYNDVIGDTVQTDRWLGWIDGAADDEWREMQAMPDFWQEAPSGGEFASGDAYRYLTDAAYAETLRQIEASHTSLIGPCLPVRPETAEVARNANDLLGRLGYRFRIHSLVHPSQARAGSTVRIRLKAENIGNSPMYYSWPVELRLQDSAGAVRGSWRLATDVRRWLPGPIEVPDTIRLPADLPPGEYRWAIAILDPDTGQPAVELANEGRQADGTYPCGTLLIPESGNETRGETT